MPIIIIDIESDGPYPPEHSMIEIGAVALKQDKMYKFESKLAPISEIYKEEALSITGYTREDTLDFPDPEVAMERFHNWLMEQIRRDGGIIFYSDCSFDWVFVNYYLWRFCGDNPFGFSAHNIDDIYKGMIHNTHKNFKHLRDTKHTHRAIDDAVGNAEALLKMIKFGLILPL